MFLIYFGCDGDDVGGESGLASREICVYGAEVVVFFNLVVIAVVIVIGASGVPCESCFYFLLLTYFYSSSTFSCAHIFMYLVFNFYKYYFDVFLSSTLSYVRVNAAFMNVIIAERT